MKKTMNDYINSQFHSLKNQLNEVPKQFKDLPKKRYQNCFILATGSSYNAALSTKSFMEEVLMCPVTIKEPAYFHDYELYDPNIDCVIAISQSGKSTSTLTAITALKNQLDCDFYVITSDPTSPLATQVENIYVLDLLMGIETVGFVTQGYTATILLLMLWALDLAEVLGIGTKRYRQQLYLDIELAINKIPIILKDTQLFFNKHQDKLLHCDRFVCIGYGPNYGTAKEFETKFTETVRVPSQGYELEAFMHGPYLETQKNHIQFYLWDHDLLSKRSQLLRSYFKEHISGSYYFTVTSEYDDAQGMFLNIDPCSSLVTPLVMIIPIQYLAYHIAIGKNIDLNQPIWQDFDDVLGSKILSKH